MEHRKSYNTIKLIYIVLNAILISNSFKLTSSEVIVSRTLVELKSLGWNVIGPVPAVYAKPSDWRRALQPLDAFVTGGGVWRITSYSRPTIFSFRTSDDLCNITSVRIEVKYFSENSILTVYPCQLSPLSSYCYGDPINPQRVEWTTKMFQLKPITLENSEIQLAVNVLPDAGGYFMFDGVTIDYVGIPCASTTTTSTTHEPIPTNSEEPTTTEIPTRYDWSTETSKDEETDEPTTASEDTTTAPTPSTEVTTPPTTEIVVTEEPLPTTEYYERSTTEEPTTTRVTTTQEPTTKEPTTPEITTFQPSTIETTTLESTTVTDISTRQPPDCSTTPNPEPCDCCDRSSSSKIIQQIHNHYHGNGDHHHHYSYPVASLNEK